MTKTVVLETAVDEAKIKSLIEAETVAYLQRNIDAMCDCWVNELYIRHITVLPYAGVVPLHGIDGLRNHFLSHFRNSEPLNVEAESIVRENWQLVIRSQMAWVTFEQCGTDAAHMSGAQMHTRILEKIDGHWKIIQSTGILPRLDFYECPKILVDGSAMIQYMNEETQKIVSAHPALRISGGRLTATMQNDAIKLASVIQQAKKDIANGSARLPVPVIFGGAAGDSSIFWVAILDMKIVVLLGDDKLINTTIETAGHIYKLSAMQRRVAKEIAKGKELASIADELNVTPNTVRTHVKRMFERVGVNNQRALLRKLLTAQSPSTGLQQQL